MFAPFVARLVPAYLVAVIASTLPVPRAAAEDARVQPSLLEQQQLTGDWAGERGQIAVRGFTPYLVYTGSMWSNLSGGIRRGTEFNGYLDFGLGVDLEQLGLWPGLGFQASWHWFQGREPSLELVGVSLGQDVNEWEAANACRVYHLNLTQRLGDGGLLKVGQVALDDDFTVSRYAGTFLNGTFGDLPTRNLNVNVPVYPLAGPGVYLGAPLGRSFTGRVGAYTADVGSDVAGNHGFGWGLGNNAGYAFFAELVLDASPGGLPGAWAVGGYYASVRSPELDGDGFVNAQGGGWLMIDQALRVDGRGNPLVGVFARFSYAPDDGSNVVQVYGDAGLDVFGPIASRPHDVFGFAGSVMRFSDAFRASERALDLAGASAEAILELTYQIAAAPWLTVQPDLQYVIDPVAADDNAIVAGLGVSVVF